MLFAQRCLLWCLLPICIVAHAGTEIPNFTATYGLHQGPLRIGTVQLDFQQLQDESYLFKSVTEADGIMAIIRDDVVTELSHFTLYDDTPMPIQYQYKQKGEKDRRVVLDFDWSDHIVTNTVMDHSWKMSIPAGTQDKASVQLALMQVLAQGDDEPVFQVADGGKLKEYAFKKVADESIEVNDHHFETIKMIRVKNHQETDTQFWCATKLHYLPILITKKKKLGLFKMELERIRFETESSN